MIEPAEARKILVNLWRRHPDKLEREAVLIAVRELEVYNCGNPR